MPNPSAYLLVEGKNDRHVVSALCGRHQLPELFGVEVPGDEEGINALLKGLSVRLKEEGLKTLGVVVDGDQDMPDRWNELRVRLERHGYQGIPDLPPSEGWVSGSPSLPRVGIWLMPDNKISGRLEDFVAELIPPNDSLRTIVDTILQRIESQGLNRYKLIHRAKAFVHTWLAWQETPGMPMGQAITAHAFVHDSQIALLFITWLRKLFQLGN